MGRGALRLTLEDSRPDTPEEILEIIRKCSQYKREERLDFVEVKIENNTFEFHFRIKFELER